MYLFVCHIIERRGALFLNPAVDDGRGAEACVVAWYGTAWHPIMVVRARALHVQIERERERVERDGESHGGFTVEESRGTATLVAVWLWRAEGGQFTQRVVVVPSERRLGP